MKVNVLLIFLFMAVTLSAYAQADDSIVVTGYGKNIEEAKHSAFSTAIEQTLGVMVSSYILIENGELINGRIRSNPQGYIESYNIISTGKDMDLYVVTMRAKVSKKKIQAQLDGIPQVNGAQMSYEAVTCWDTPKGNMCKGGDLAMGNMNLGIYDASYATLRHYSSKDVIQSQVYFSLTLPSKGYFHEVSDQNGNKYELNYIYPVNEPAPSSAETVTEDFIVPVDLKVMKQFADTGLELTVKGGEKTVKINIPGAYIKGFITYIENKN